MMQSNPFRLPADGETRVVNFSGGQSSAYMLRQILRPMMASSRIPTSFSPTPDGNARKHSISSTAAARSGTFPSFGSSISIGPKPKAGDTIRGTTIVSWGTTLPPGTASRSSPLSPTRNFSPIPSCAFAPRSSRSGRSSDTCAAIMASNHSVRFSASATTNLNDGRRRSTPNAARNTPSCMPTSTRRPYAAFRTANRSTLPFPRPGEIAICATSSPAETKSSTSGASPRPPSGGTNWNNSSGKYAALSCENRRWPNSRRTTPTPTSSMKRRTSSRSRSNIRTSQRKSIAFAGIDQVFVAAKSTARPLVECYTHGLVVEKSIATATPPPV